MLPRCRSTASARQRTTGESTFTKLSSIRNLFNNGEQSLNCYGQMTIIVKPNTCSVAVNYRSCTASAKAKAVT